MSGAVEVCGMWSDERRTTMTTTFQMRRFAAGMLSGWLLLVIAVLPAAAKEKDRCEGTKRQRRQKMALRELTDEQLREMQADYAAESQADRRHLADTVLPRLERKYRDSRDSGAEFVYDILVISGGGAKGAFGAGFMEGWGAVPPGPDARPEFDMVTGVSTGTLIAPFAFVGTDEAYTSVVEFYANPEKNWVKKRGVFFFKKGHASLFNNCHLQDTIRGAVREPLVRALAEAAGEDRLLLIGTANLDMGVGRVFDLGRESRRALDDGSFDRTHSILLASSAIPGVFPPIEIDGLLYADGGASSNIFLAGLPRDNGPVARFIAMHPEAPAPNLRIWVLVNGWLQPEPKVVQPRWLSVSGQSLGVLTSTAQLFALQLVSTLAYEARVELGMDAEFRLVAIPDDALREQPEEMFDRAYMIELEEFGRTLGADPSSWTARIPSAFWEE